MSCSPRLDSKVGATELDVDGSDTLVMHYHTVTARSRDEDRSEGSKLEAQSKGTGSSMVV